MHNGPRPFWIVSAAKMNTNSSFKPFSLISVLGAHFPYLPVILLVHHHLNYNLHITNGPTWKDTSSDAPWNSWVRSPDKSLQHHLPDLPPCKWHPNQTIFTITISYYWIVTTTSQGHMTKVSTRSLTHSLRLRLRPIDRTLATPGSSKN